MALGLASVSTNINAIPEAIIDKETGLLVEAGDAKSLARSIVRLKEDKRLRSRLAQTGRNFVLENFDERRVADQIIRCYDRSLRSE